MAIAQMRAVIEGLDLHTVCESARCPNIGECFARQTATFMIMGDVCTRNCSFCATLKGRPLPLSSNEPENVAEATARLRLGHVVVTSVTRDDLPDGGASHFAKTIDAIRAAVPRATVELLIPDFQGSDEALETVVRRHPEVIGHNVETAPRLYPEVRHRADYQRSLRLLRRVKEMDEGIVTKSGLMLGLGEEDEEVRSVMRDLRQAGCELLTLGQYLRPTLQHREVTRYIPPEEFKEYEKAAEDMGFMGVASAPFARSSFMAAEMYRRAAERKSSPCAEVAHDRTDGKIN